MKRHKDEREDCEMNTDYLMKKKETKKWVVMNISNKNKFQVYLNVIAFNSHLLNEQLECCVIDVVYLKKKRE